MTDIIVIGGGASGMTAAVRAAERGRSVLLIEKSDRIGRKILASGNGRCNLLNKSSLQYFGDTDFALKVLKNCPPHKIERFFQHYGLMITEESDGRFYPVSFQASSVLSVFRDALDVNGVDIRTGTRAVSICRHNHYFSVKTDSGEVLEAPFVIISCGGPAQPSAGGTDDGLKLLRQTGHAIIPASPALVPLRTDSRSISGLSGIRVKCSVSVIRDRKLLHREHGELLFTDYGVSGICVMQCSKFAAPDTVLEIDFLSRIIPDPRNAAAELKRRRELYANRSPVCLLDGIIAEKISYAVLKQADIPLRGEKAGSLSDDDLKRIAEKAYRYRLCVRGNRGMEYAQVTAGGAECGAFDPDTMASYICQGLYATGEVLNVDGGCGGFNLMFAFATGLIAGNAV